MTPLQLNYAEMCFALTKAHFESIHIISLSLTGGLTTVFDYTNLQ